MAVTFSNNTGRVTGFDVRLNNPYWILKDFDLWFEWELANIGRHKQGYTTIS